ncbi:25538_t:CDS:1 [Gigaspora margarita]|nr:25538_t:CDS:1 [Gigaspora margarita]
MSKILNQACMIRIISFILMWSYTGIFGLSILFEITQEYSCHRNIDHDLEYEEKEQGIPFRPLSSTSEMQTRNGSKSKNEIPINEISINGSHNRSSNVPMSKSQPSPLSRPKPTHKNIFSPPSHEPK